MTFRTSVETIYRYISICSLCISTCKIMYDAAYTCIWHWLGVHDITPLEKSVNSNSTFATTSCSCTPTRWFGAVKTIPLSVDFISHIVPSFSPFNNASLMFKRRRQPSIDSMAGRPIIERKAARAAFLSAETPMRFMMLTRTTLKEVTETSRMLA